jgi:WhiB family redox-sensing transcriptional regulator
MRLLKDHEILSLVRKLEPGLEKDKRWRDDAACLTQDPELFFPIGNTGPAVQWAEDAKAVCDLCPVEAKCLVWSLLKGYNDGVWGGLDENERRIQRRRLKRAQDAERGEAKLRAS